MAEQTRLRAEQVLETCLYVDDLDAAEAFYQQVIGLKLVSRLAGRHVFFRCGASMFLLFDPHATTKATGSIPVHGAHGAGHVAFAATPEDLAGWREQLAVHAVVIEAEITWPNGGQSIYFRDPAGNCVELATAHIWPLAGDD